MKTYFLLLTPNDDEIIADSHLGSHICLKQIQANSWIEAKSLLGYPLTDLQYEMLENRTE